MSEGCIGTSSERKDLYQSFAIKAGTIPDILYFAIELPSFWYNKIECFLYYQLRNPFGILQEPQSYPRKKDKQTGASQSTSHTSG